jgi:hypothetical protein
LANESHCQHSAEVLCRFLEATEYPPVLFEPTDEPLDDVALAVQASIEFYTAKAAILVFLGGDHRLNAQLEQVIIDPIRAIAFVASQRDGPRHRMTLDVHDAFICAAQQRFQCRRLVNLTRRKVEVQWFSLPVTEDVNFRGEPATRAT